MITLTVQLAIWLGCTIPGFLCAIFLAFRTYGRLQVLRHVAADTDLVVATFVLFIIQVIGMLYWSVALAIGLAALFDTSTAGPVGQTLIGQLIVAGLLLFIGLLMLQTAFGFVAGEQLDRRTRDKVIDASTE